MSSLSVEDLFTAGVGLDFAGAYLLGRGLLETPERMVRRATTVWNTSAVDLERRAEDRIDAQAGIAALLAGLVLQLVGYSAVLSGRRVGSGRDLAFVALAVGVLSACAAFVTWRSVRPPLLRRLLVELAIQVPRSGALPIDPKVGQPEGTVLEAMGEAAGYPSREGESRAAYLARVFDVHEYYDPNDAYGDR